MAACQSTLQFLMSMVGNYCVVEVELLEPLEAEECLVTLVGDERAVQTQRLQVLQGGEIGQAVIGNACGVEVKIFECGEAGDDLHGFVGQPGAQQTQASQVLETGEVCESRIGE